MELSPRLYHRLVRPKWFLNTCVIKVIGNSSELDGKRVLDFGSGIGTSCGMFQPDYYLGFDCDSRRVDYARRLNPGYNFQVIKGEKLQLPDNSMDIILIVSVLHHIQPSSLSAFVKEFGRVLKPQGKVLVLEPCFLEGRRLSNLCMRVMDRGEYISTVDEYVRAFTRNSFNVNINKSFRQMMLYNKVFFTAEPIPALN